MWVSASAYAQQRLLELVGLKAVPMLTMRAVVLSLRTSRHGQKPFEMTPMEQSEALDTQVEQILEEARMVLPGIQTLFGFQLIAVFNQRFEEALGRPWQLLHLAAVVLTAVAVGLIMAPAAYHRQAEPNRASRYFASYASFAITLAMVPLAAALAVEVSVVAFVVTRQTAPSAIIGAALALCLIWLWYVFPAYRRRYRVTPLRTRSSRGDG